MPSPDSKAPKTYQILTLGCKVNQAESLGLEHQLETLGYRAAGPDEALDVCVINTCTVTQKASMQSRQAIRQIKRKHPGCRTFVTGCYAQVDPQALQEIPQVDTLVGNTLKHRLADLIGKATDQPATTRVHHGPMEEETVFQTVGLTQDQGRTRGFLKIQDGCDAHCAYCIVPHARGPSRSLPPGKVLATLDEMAALGYREVILTGVHLGCYGLDLSSPGSLTALLQSMTLPAGLERIRLSSIEPNEISDALLGCLRDLDWICPHLHLPLQSGDDAVLRRMRRPYTRDQFRLTVARIQKALPQVTLGLDVLVGFPGESDGQFENTLDLVAELPVAYLHVFPFSPRPGTPAAKYENPVPSQTIKDRCRALRTLGEEKRNTFLSQQIGQERQVLIEGPFKKDTRYMKGMSADYIPVLVKSSTAFQANRMLTVRLSEIYALNPVFVLGDHGHGKSP